VFSKVQEDQIKDLSWDVDLGHNGRMLWNMLSKDSVVVVDAARVAEIQKFV
jgi:hypothetical protein